MACSEPNAETEEHKRPSYKPTGTGEAALLVAFPKPGAIPLPPSNVVLGRDWLAEHGITDRKASARHVRFSRAGGGLFVEDVGSRNGTYVDGQPLEPAKRVSLPDGSTLRIGRTVLVYRPSLVGPLVPSPPVGDLVGPFGLRLVADSLESLALRPPPNVLIEGETGTGKELVAAAVASRLRPSRPFAPVNVAALPLGVFESQLFGYVAGAFSGSGRGSPGILSRHEGGTVFLDEIGELPLDLQPKLLRLLENREVLPVGGDQPKQVDVLLVAATNRALEEMVEKGEFRRDLYARLAAARIELPPLRERVEDLMAIAYRLGERRDEPYDPDEIEVEAVERLMNHSWLSNVRELAAVLDRVAAVHPPPALTFQSVSSVLGAVPVARPAPLTAERVSDALRRADGNQSKAARLLGITRGRLLRWLKAEAESGL